MLTFGEKEQGVKQGYMNYYHLTNRALVSLV